MWYWIIMFLLAAGCAGMLAVTFISIKKQKAEKPASRRRGRRAAGAAARSGEESAFAGTGRPAESAGKKTKKKEKETVENYSRGYRQLGKVQFHIL